MPAQRASAPFAKTDAALWSQMLARQPHGQSILVTPGGRREMLTRGRGRIINIASTAGLAAMPMSRPMCAAKHGVVGLTRALALEFAARA